MVRTATAYNRAYLAPCLRHFAQIPLRGTSDTLGTLYVISVVLDKGEDLLTALKSLKSMLKNMMNGLMQIDLPMSPKSKP